MSEVAPLIVRLTFSAFQTTELPHALLSHPPPHHDTSSDRSGKGHSMWLQIVLAANAALHYPIHALRRLDLRRRDAHAG
jgi:hypothetical protein